jgi:hypothetical protein
MTTTLRHALYPFAMIKSEKWWEEGGDELEGKIDMRERLHSRRSNLCNYHLFMLSALPTDVYIHQAGKFYTFYLFLFRLSRVYIDVHWYSSVDQAYFHTADIVFLFFFARI